MCNRIIPEQSRVALGELAARAGELTARRLFAARGNRSEAHLREIELAMIAATAARVALEGFARRNSGAALDALAGVQDRD